MLALALALTAFPSLLPEIAVPAGYTLEDVQAVGPRGELAVTVEPKGESVLGILRNGKVTEITPLDKSLFYYGQNNPIVYFVQGFLPDGSFFGTAGSGSSGAMLASESRPYIALNGVARLVPLPEEFKAWEHARVHAVRPNGEILLEVQESGGYMDHDNPGSNAERLIWVKDGKLLQDLGPACQPFMDPQGNLLAVQYRDTEGNLMPAHYNRPIPHILAWSNGKLEEIAIGSPIGFLPDGSLYFSRFTPTTQCENVINYSEGTYTYHRLKDGQVSDISAAHLSKNLMLDPKGQGIHMQYRDSKLTVRAVDGKKSYELTDHLPHENLALECAGGGLYIFSSYDSETERNRFYAYRLGQKLPAP